jgi:hypothetical protein
MTLNYVSTFAGAVQCLILFARMFVQPKTEYVLGKEIYLEAKKTFLKIQ